MSPDLTAGMSGAGMYIYIGAARAYELHQVVKILDTARRTGSCIPRNHARDRALCDDTLYPTIGWA